jgi:hypothetical protein
MPTGLLSSSKKNRPLYLNRNRITDLLVGDANCVRPPFGGPATRSSWRGVSDPTKHQSQAQQRAQPTGGTFHEHHRAVEEAVIIPGASRQAFSRQSVKFNTAAKLTHAR